MRSARSRVARRRRSGQAPSCTWATTTRRHSRPLDRWAVSSRTASPRMPWSASVSAGISWATRVARNASTLVWPRCSSARAAVSKSAHSGIEVAVGRDAHRRRRAGRGGAATRASRCPTTAPRAPPRPCRRRRAARAPCAAAWRAPRRAGPRRRCRTPAPARRRRARPRAAARATAAACGPRPARAPCRSRAAPGRAHADVGGVEARQRRDQQPLGRHGVEVVGVVGVVVVEVDHGAQRVEQRAYGGLAHQRRLVAGHLDGHAGTGEAAPQHRDGGAARSGPAPPSATTGRRPRDGPAAAGRPAARPRRARCRR